MNIPENLLSVKIDENLFAFDGDKIEQILRVPDVTAIPLADKGVKGVSTISGKVVAIIDMGEVLSLSSVDEKKLSARVLTIACDGCDYGILVDEVLGMEAVDEINYEVSEESAAVICGFYKTETDIYQIINECVSINTLTLHDFKPVELDSYDENKNENSEELSSQESDRCIFLTLGDEEFAISLEVAREIIFVPKNITPISDANFGVMGMITLRDELIVALNLKQLIGVDENNDDKKVQEKEKRLLILSAHEKSIALLVDSISEVKDILTNLTEKLPERFADSKIEAVYKEEESIASILSEKYLTDLLNEYSISHDKKSVHVSDEDANKDQEDEEMSEVAVFQIAGEEFALDIEDVQEIIRYTQITNIPEAPEFVDGVINLRGVVIPIVSLPERLDFEKVITPKSKILVSTILDEKIGLLVDDVNEVMFIDNKYVNKSSSSDALFSDVITLDEGKRIILKLRISSVLDQKTIDSIKLIQK